MTDYNRLIDHTLLKADASSQAISNLCNEALQWNFYSVCVNPSYVNLASQKLAKTGIKICSVVGFPLGQTSTKQKVYEAKQALKAGANEIDMVINIPELKVNCACVVDEIRAIKRICKKNVLKVILETALLTNEEIKKGTLAAIEARADFVKTSTGFSTRGASVEDVEIMKKTAEGRIKIKASGGIKNLTDLVKMVNAGADRIGASSGVLIMQELAAKSKT